VGPKHVEIRQYINKIEIVTSVGFYSISLQLYQKGDEEFFRCDNERLSNIPRCAIPETVSTLHNNVFPLLLLS